MKLGAITNKTWNYPTAVALWIVLFLIYVFLLRIVDLTSEIWILLALIGSGGLALGSSATVPKRQSMQLVLFGEQTGLWIGEGFYFLFWVFTLDEHEKQDKEFQTLVIKPFELRCKDKVLVVNFNLKYLQGKSNKENPTAEDERIAQENFKNNKSDTLNEDLEDMMKGLAMVEFGSKNYSDLHGNNLSDMIFGNNHFNNECYDYGIKMKSLLPFVLPKNGTQEDLDLRKRQLITEYHDLGYSNQEAREMAEIQLDQIKVVKTQGGTTGGGGVFGHYNI